jgi:RNA polymerase sigma-70 factor, ECF subfamily
MMAKLRPLHRQEGIPAEMSDEALVSVCAAGDTAALAALFDRYHKDVHRFLSRLSGVDDHAVDDLLQETFYQLFVSAGRYRRRSTVRTWLYAIAANLARRQTRSDIRQKTRARAFAEGMIAEARDPSDLAEHRQLIDRLQTALFELPHELRVVYVMCDVEETRGVDAARALGLREGTLYRRLHEARQRLRAALGGGVQ